MKTFKIILKFLLTWILIHLGILLIIGLQSTKQNADAILIFGNKVEKTGEVSPRLKSRLDTGLKLYNNKQAPLIIVSGGFGKEGYDEALVMQKYLENKGVPSNKIIRDSNGNSTYFTAKNFQAIAEENSISKVIIVSQYYHILRAKTAFQKAGEQTIYTSPAKMLELRDLYSIPREIVGFYPYLLKKYSSNYSYSTHYFKDKTLDVVKIKQEDLAKLKSFYNPLKPSQIPTSVTEHKLSFATNGGIFSKTYEPLGLYIQNKEKISPLNLKEGEGNFYLKPNGVFQIQNERASIIKTDDFIESANTSLAIQSGPLLINDNDINSAFSPNSQNLRIRSGVGTDQSGNTYFVISNQAISFYDFAQFFQTELKCPNALYLDGTISEMHIKDQRHTSLENFSVILGIE